MKLHLSPDAPAGTVPDPTTAMSDWMKSLPSEVEVPPVNSGVPGAPGAIAEPPPPPPPKPEPPKPTPAPAPAPAPAAAEDDDKDETKWPRTAADWKKFKASRKEAEEKMRQERDAIKTELESVKAEIAKAKKEGPSPELESLKKERDELDAALKRTAVENHPKFKAFYDAKINGKIVQAKLLVGADHAGEVEKLLQQPDSEWRTAKLEEIISELPTIRQGQFAALLNGLDEVKAERQAEIDKARENAAVIATQQEAAIKAQNEQTSKLIDDTLAGMAGDELKGIITPEDIQFTKGVCLQGTKDPADFVKTVARGAAYPAMLKGWLADKKRIEELEGQVKALQTAQPGAGQGGSGGEPEPGNAPIRVGMTPGEASSTFIKNIQTAMRG